MPLYLEPDTEVVVGEFWKWIKCDVIKSCPRWLVLVSGESVVAKKLGILVESSGEISSDLVDR